MKHTYQTKNTCSSRIEFELDGDCVTNIKFTGGCDGNLKAIARILDGCSAADIVEKCKGNICGWRSTSCVDQLATAVESAYTQS